MNLIQTMRWYGPNDIVSLKDIKQAGCSGIVTALHQIPVGEIWSIKEILERKKLIEDAGMFWSVVESLPVHDDIKKRNGDFIKFIENYKASITNLAACGIKIITYNFMPVLDWMRTNLKYTTASGALTLRFEKLAFITFDIFLLKRPSAVLEYTQQEINNAKEYYNNLSDNARQELLNTCLQALPGTSENFSTEQVLSLLNEYEGITDLILKENLVLFLEVIVPLADELGIQLAIHPDDPPYPILGLPRIMSTEEDAAYILEAVPNKSNGICFCSGSFGAREDNDLTGMIKRLGNRIYFLHLRSTERDLEGNFQEANHLEGNADMFSLMKEIISLMKRENRSIPMRPDHGHQMLDDIHKNPYPGYSAIGRLKALAELRGLEIGIRKSLHQ